MKHNRFIVVRGNKLSIYNMEVKMNSQNRFGGLSYEEAVRKYADMITRVCIMRCGNVEDAKDCFQNVVLKLYLSESGFETESHLKAWLLTVAIHQCQDMVKQYWKKNITLSGDTYLFDSCLDDDATQEDTEVIAAVLSLPTKYRQIIYLYYYEEYDVREITNIVGLKETTVKSQLRRGRILLKNKLGGIVNEKAN